VAEVGLVVGTEVAGGNTRLAGVVEVVTGISMIVTGGCPSLLATDGGANDAVRSRATQIMAAKGKP
jgi:hypothetical protein